MKIPVQMLLEGKWTDVGLAKENDNNQLLVVVDLSDPKVRDIFQPANLAPTAISVGALKPQQPSDKDY